MNDVIVIGGGAAGMMAAISATSIGHQVVLLEKNEKLGKKIYITGKGRCNVFNACTKETFFDSVSSNKKFLYSSYNNFTSEDAYSFFEELGLDIKIERGNRAFPVSDHASDVTKVLEKRLKLLGVEVKLNCEVSKINILTNISYSENTINNTDINECVDEVNFKIDFIDERNKRQEIFSKNLIVATGGLSYKTTGSTGDGLKWAKESGHEIITPIPSLVGLNSSSYICKELQGLSLKNVNISILKNEKEIYSEFGEMLFTHFGISGPIVLSGSSRIGREIFEHTGKTELNKRRDDISAVIDLKPKLTIEELDKRLLKQIETDGNKVFKNSLSGWIPKSMEQVVIRESKIDAMKSIKFLSRQERRDFISILKNLKIPIIGLRDFNEAIITKGGISVQNINPKTMESKIVPHLYFVGEILDLDALTGGFNLQIAWSTGYAAGSNIEF